MSGLDKVAGNVAAGGQTCAEDWVPNRGDEGWALDVLTDAGKPKRFMQPGPVQTS
jgi:hypothetical protein